VTLIHLPVVRQISIIKDIKALFLLINHLSSENFLLIHSITPKAGLLSMIAGFTSGIQFRLHTFTGQVWSTKKFIFKSFLKNLDRLISLLSTHIIVDSFSQRNFLERENILRIGKSIVFGKGSITGIDTERFRYDELCRKDIRKKHDVSNDCVILYVGRLNREKGLHELIEAFTILRLDNAHLKLWIVGEDEESIVNTYSEVSGINFFGYQDVPEFFMQAADIFCLPSHREGFGNVIIESAACGLPSVVSNIYGLEDSVIDGETGLYSEPHSVNSLVKSLKVLIYDKNFRVKLGKAARKRALKDFSQEKLTKLQLNFYKGLLDE